MTFSDKTLTQDIRDAVANLDRSACDFINGSGMEVPGTTSRNPDHDDYAGRFLALAQQVQDLWNDCDRAIEGN